MTEEKAKYEVKDKGKIMEAKLYFQVVCPKCNFVMMKNEDMNIRCVNPDCKLYNILYKAPTAKLRRMSNDRRKSTLRNER